MSDLISRAEAEQLRERIAELEAALIAVTPKDRVKGKCWCPPGRDIKGHGHEPSCYQAQAAIRGAQ